ncbi:MAG: hypothetical protein LC672_00705 [Acidobacteria bacterium]|nr:hypothetical protein [Acidobacteriota bacterium]
MAANFSSALVPSKATATPTSGNEPAATPKLRGQETDFLAGTLTETPNWLQLTRPKTRHRSLVDAIPLS